ncbi:MAG: response regulator transcription factor [Rubrobacteraceae bacterium]|uniref:response regulator transcription factor n=1 Tax=Rubrobacter naiadicus TaxID=1392641 RepID=UPI002361CBE2|nr:response regulator transcription factor [Rubrobacter naiadicus]MBX6763826.1 response regulator transcription factor [Rubrobacteraceae bacterium]
MPRVLVVEDDAAVRRVVEYALGGEGIEVEAASSGREATELLEGEGPFDLVILDWMLPDTDGIALCRRIRASGSGMENVPIIMLSVRDDETSIVVGLEVGADDYVTKPFSPRELASRVRAHLRRRRSRAAPQSETLKFDGLEIDLSRRRVFREGEPVRLTNREFEILAFLASRPGEVCDRERILRHIWGGCFYGEPRVVDVHIQHIRHKIEPDPENPRYIQTVFGAGYRFTEE